MCQCPSLAEKAHISRLPLRLPVPLSPSREKSRAQERGCPARLTMTSTSCPDSSPGWLPLLQVLPLPHNACPRKPPLTLSLLCLFLPQHPLPPYPSAGCLPVTAACFTLHSAVIFGQGLCTIFVFTFILKI